MSQLKHLYTFVCKESKIDADTNNLSIVDLYEKLRFDAQLSEDVHLNKTESTPFLVSFPFEITTVFYRKDTDRRVEADFQVHSFDPKSKLLGSFPAHIVLEKGISRVRTRIKLPNLALTVSGTYTFEISLLSDKGQSKVAEVPLEISVNIK